ncbi:unnamed protein product [marine sediment metagenome]|uniref:Uncharacterized protein n=1 Tax=marine sediment metagenome TaxID=412755 RepID=X0S300_9ZZZZ
MSNNIDFAYERMKREINKKWTPKPEWEDEHPILATLLIIAVLLFNPVSLFIIGCFSVLCVILGALL